MNEVNQAIHIVADHVVQKNRENIAIIAIYGSYALGTETSLSDVDVFMIVDEEPTEKINCNIIFQGKPISFWQMDWKKAEKMASGEEGFIGIWCNAASLFVNNSLLYSRSKDDLEKFKSLKDLVEEANNDRNGKLSHVVNSFNKLFDIERISFAKEKDDILYARWVVWGLLNNLASLLSWVNGKFYTKNWGSSIEQILQLPLLPEGLKELVDVLVSSDDYDELLIAGRKLVRRTRKLVREEQEKIKPSFDTTSEVFVHIKEYLNKIYSACEREDIYPASYAATELQIWLTELMALRERKHATNFNLASEVSSYYAQLLPDLTSFITKKDFTGLKEATEIFEANLVKFITERIGKIPFIDTLEELNTFLGDEQRLV
ncbi:MAG: nucleotidyltransferase domain-containing protein [Candidatus Kariarchaeaceae archaeon]